jgi:hypothetical protein
MNREPVIIFGVENKNWKVLELSLSRVLSCTGFWFFSQLDDGRNVLMEAEAGKRQRRSKPMTL